MWSIVRRSPTELNAYCEIVSGQCCANLECYFFTSFWLLVSGCKLDFFLIIFCLGVSCLSVTLDFCFIYATINLTVSDGAGLIYDFPFKNFPSQ